MHFAFDLLGVAEADSTASLSFFVAFLRGVSGGVSASDLAAADFALGDLGALLGAVLGEDEGTLTSS